MDSDPRTDIILERCRQLDIPLKGKKGKQYSFGTLRSACMKRKINKQDAIPRSTLALSKKPSYLPSNFLVGHVEHGPTGIQYIVAQDRLKRRYWKMLPFRGDEGEGEEEENQRGGSIPILSHPKLKTYLEKNNIDRLTPDTMIPSNLITSLVPKRIDLDKLAAKYNYLPFRVIM